MYVEIDGDGPLLRYGPFVSVEKTTYGPLIGKRADGNETIVAEFSTESGGFCESCRHEYAAITPRNTDGSRITGQFSGDRNLDNVRLLFTHD